MIIVITDACFLIDLIDIDLCGYPESLSWRIGIYFIPPPSIPPAGGGKQSFELELYREPHK